MLSIGLINDMYSESRNDDYKYAELAIQEDFDRFLIENIAFFCYIYNTRKRLDSCGGMYGLKKNY